MNDRIRKALQILGRKIPTRTSDLNKAVEIALLAPYFSSKPPEGLFPTSYHTLTYEGDMEQYERLWELVDSVVGES